MKKFLFGFVCILAFSFPASTAQADCNFRKIFAKVSPSVVMIKGDYAYINPLTGKQGVTFFVGSGVIMSEDGIVATVLHVVEKTTDIPIPSGDSSVRLIGQSISFVVFYGDQCRTARVIAEDIVTHVALIKINHQPGERFVPAVFGDTDQLRTGDCIASIGAPFGNRLRMKNGIVAGIDRLFREELLHRPYLISNVSLDPGDSGGVMVDSHGKIIGINEYSIKGSDLSGSVLLDATAQQRIKTLASGRSLTYPIMNDSLVDLSRIDETMSVADQVAFRSRYHLSPDVRSGVMVVDPATSIFIEGDIIIAFDGIPIKDLSHLFDLIITSHPRTKALFDIIRHGKRLQKTVVLETATITPRP